MGFFSKIKNALQKTSKNFSQKIYTSFKGKALDEEFYQGIEDALIMADVGFEATEDIIENFKEKCFENKVSSPEKAKELLKDTMVESIDYDIQPFSYPLVILVAGVNGVGKTTALGKLAKYFKDQNKSVIMAAADTFRAAASDQLTVWAERADVRIVKHYEGADAGSVVFDAIKAAKTNNADVVLIDTAGRLHNKKNLMNELSKINRIVEKELPNADYRSYIVLDATTGQNAVAQVEIFNEFVDIDGIILNKLDGTAKGGVVFAISAEKELPVCYVGVGEKITDLIEFNAEDFVDALLGF